MLWAIIGVVVVVAVLVAVVTWSSRTPPNDDDARARDSVGASGRVDP
jgi:hypothetical protein